MVQTEKVYLYGASGHAKVVLDIARKAYLDIPFLIDDNPHVNELAGLPVVHSADGLFPLIVTIGDCQIRRAVVEKLGNRDCVTVIHPDAIIAYSVRFVSGTVVMAGSILNPIVKVGNHCIINTGASIDHVVKVGIFVHSAPHCTLCGGAEVGEGTRIGAGSTLIQGIHIGRDYNIEAGSVVVNDIPDGVLSFGSPARIIKYNNNYADKRAHSINLFGGEMGVCEAAYNKYAA